MEDEPILLDEDVKAESTNEEAPEVEAKTTDSEPSPGETKAEAKTSDEEPSEDKETEGESEGDDSDEADETEDDQPKDRAEIRQEKLNTEIRELVAKRNELRNEVAAINANAYRPQTAEELMDAGMDEATARVAALEQRTQMAEFNAHVSDLNASLNTEALQVMHDYQIFDEQSENYKPEIAELAKSVYNAVASPKTDPKTGLIYETNATPYPVFQAIARAFEAGAQTGKVSGAKANDKMLAAADTPSSAAPKQPKVDADMAAFEAEFDKV